MADAVTIQTIMSERHKLVMRFTNKSDGTGESAVLKVDKSTYVDMNGEEPRRFIIDRVSGYTDGMNVSILFDHTTDDLGLVVSGPNLDRDLQCEFGGLKDPLSVGGPGDILFTTLGHTAGDSYDLTLHMRLEASPK